MATPIKTVSEIPFIDNNLLKSIYAELTRREGPQILIKLNNYIESGETPLIIEALHYNIYSEYQAMTTYIKLRGFTSNYENGRYKVLEFIINCIIADPLNGDYADKSNSDLLKEAGRLLSTEQAMDDDLVWDFIPKRL